MSVQQTRYLALRAEGLTRDDAAFEAGIPAAEAEMIDAAKRRGEIAAPTIHHEGVNTMARNAKPKDDEVTEIKKPDFAQAVRIYRQDIRPAQAKVGEYAQEQSTAYKEIKKGCNVHPGAAKLAFKLDEMEDHKRADYLRSLYGLMQALKIGISADLVDKIEDDEAPRMPVAERKPVELVTVQ